MAHTVHAVYIQHTCMHTSRCTKICVHTHTNTQLLYCIDCDFNNMVIYIHRCVLYVHMLTITIILFCQHIDGILIVYIIKNFNMAYINIIACFCMALKLHKFSQIPPIHIYT